MQKKTTELEKILNNSNVGDFDKFQAENKDATVEPGESFSIYFRELLEKKNLTQLKVFLRADIPERYGYKILAGEKRTRQRDILLRLCYAADFNLEETQRFLKMYELPTLYAKIPRDALLMLIFNEHTKNILEINEILKSKGFEPLRTSGSQD